MSTHPAEIALTVSTPHMITSFIFLYSNLAFWTFSRLPLAQIRLHSRSLTTTDLLMPQLSAVPTELKPAITGHFHLLYRPFLHNLVSFAVWLRTPDSQMVLVNLSILINIHQLGVLDICAQISQLLDLDELFADALYLRSVI